jgi:hypothetical protein
MRFTLLGSLCSVRVHRFTFGSGCGSPHREPRTSNCEPKLNTNKEARTEKGEYVE